MSRWFVSSIVLAGFLCLSLGTVPVWSQEMSEDVAVAIAEDYEVEWIWGDVTSKTASSVTIQYLDYEDDIEKQMTLQVNDQTAYENVTALADIQIGDTLSIDYTMQSNGEGLASLISKEDALDSTESSDTAMLEGDLLGPASEDDGVSSIPVE